MKSSFLYFCQYHQTDFEKEILVLYDEKSAVLVNSAGEKEELTCFEQDPATKASQSCSVNWHNQLFIFGGINEFKRQISRLTGHKLERVKDLTFDLIQGACGVMANKDIFLCFHGLDFDGTERRRCRRSTGPLEQFSEVAPSASDHRHTQISCSDSKLKLTKN